MAFGKLVSGAMKAAAGMKAAKPKRPNANFGPGSISTVAKGRLAGIPNQPPPTARVMPKVAAPKATLLNALQPLSPSAQQIKGRIDQEKALNQEVGGRKYRGGY